MGKLECSVCGGVCEKPTFKEAADSLDHGIGLTKGRPCPNDGKHLYWDGKPVDPAHPPRDESKDAARLEPDKPKTIPTKKIVKKF